VAEQKEGCTCGSTTIKTRTKAQYEQQWSSQSEKAADDRRRTLSIIADPLISMAHPLGGKVVADLGVGTGCLAFRAMELSPPKMVVGIDFSNAGLCVAHTISRHSKFKEMECELVQADLEMIPLKSKSVDVVISQATLNLLPDKCTAMREIARITKSGGKVAISDAFRTSNPTEDESWEQCIAGTVTVAEFSNLALSNSLFIAGQIDLTQQVRMLVRDKKWDWPEFLEHNMDYRGFLLTRS